MEGNVGFPRHRLRSKSTHCGPRVTSYRVTMSERPDYSTMTVNERLAETGLLEAFDIAVKARNREAMVRLLAKVAVADPASTVDPILNDPKRYGY